jgi:amidohydrolase
MHRTISIPLYSVFICCLLFLILPPSVHAQADVGPRLAKHQGHLEQLYMGLHHSPELSFMEFNTSEKLAGGLRSLGFEVHEGISGNTLVGLFRNGEGPVIMVRTDMDALPIEEKTGLPYASRVVTADREGNQVAAMHACGHDMHMTVWTGTAGVMVDLKDQWKGTLMMIAQQAEERSGGAKNVLEAGLYQKFPIPDYALAYHVSERLPAGTVGYRSGPIMAGVSSVDITIYGEGGHGAQPDRTIDPIVLAARMIMDIQTIVSRELSPLQPAVVTVGSIHGGTKHNIIPEEVKLQLTIRYYDESVGQQIISALKRIGNGLAASAGLPPEKYPVVTVQDESTAPVINDPNLTSRLVPVLTSAFGNENVIEMEPLMVGEDFGQYGLTPEKVPICLMWLGSIDPEKFNSGELIPGLHTAYYYPDYPATIRTGVEGMVAMLLELFTHPL